MKQNKKPGKSTEISLFRPNFRKINGTEHHYLKLFLIISNFHLDYLFNFCLNFKSRLNLLLVEQK